MMNQDTDWTSVAVYVPPTAVPGIATEIVGFHDALLSPLPTVPATTVCGVLASVMSVAVMVLAPLMKSVDDAVAVHEALDSARLSVTVTSPIGAPIVVPGAPEPRFAAPGAVIVSAPDVTVHVRVVSGSPLATVAAARWSE